jgi:hypothetical protein
VIAKPDARAMAWADAVDVLDQSMDLQGLQRDESLRAAYVRRPA